MVIATISSIKEKPALARRERIMAGLSRLFRRLERRRPHHHHRRRRQPPG
jgi:hypothetical protein